MQTFNVRWIHGFGITVLILINLFGNPIPDAALWKEGLLTYLCLIVLIAMQWLGIVKVVDWSWQKLPDLNSVKPRLIRSMVLSLLWVMPLTMLGNEISRRLLTQGPFTITLTDVVGYFINALIFSFTVMGITEAIYYYSRLRKAEKEKEELQRINLMAQYDSLKQQVNPHFLFNSLNSLSSLIATNPPKAEKFVEEMSSVYRYLLQNSKEELSPLSRELAFARSYLHLLQTRFGEGLLVDIRIPGDLETALIPPLTLQLLIENAVKHNEVSSANPLHLSIEVKDGQRLEVVNNLQKRKLTMPSEKIGLANIMAKYKLLGYNEVEVRETPTHFMVSLPLIKKNIPT